MQAEESYNITSNLKRTDGEMHKILPCKQLVKVHCGVSVTFCLAQLAAVRKPGRRLQPIAGEARFILSRTRLRTVGTEIGIYCSYQIT